MRMLSVLTCALFSMSAVAGGLEVGEPVPAFDIKLTNGHHVTPAVAAGRVTIINFWATWCAPCRKEMPALEEFYRKYHAQGVDVIAVSIDKASDQAEAQTVMKSYTFPLAFVGDADVKGFGRLWRIPVTFVVDQHGILRRDGWHAEPTVDLELLEKQVVPLLRP
ncbi:TlpA family protein disulfide reductase [Cupriavidus sp. CuC1]|uniref:TlpA family protein disulfide reductase n=1 Tax=Cupriavidus sp. CuC1 TaxID=3373131 RepID=UPI0037D82325